MKFAKGLLVSSADKINVEKQLIDVSHTCKCQNYLSLDLLKTKKIWRGNLLNIKIKIDLQESTANEVLFERSHFRILSQEPKVTNIKVHVFHHLFKKF